MIAILVIVLLVFALAVGGWGHSRNGAGTWSPAGIIVVIAAILFFTGQMHIG